MTDGSSGTGACTSEIASVRLRAAAAPSRPPLTADRCLRTQFNRSMGRPARRSTSVARIFSSSVSGGAGAASMADAPPDRSTTSHPSLIAARHLECMTGGSDAGLIRQLDGPPRTRPSHAAEASGRREAPRRRSHAPDRQGAPTWRRPSATPPFLLQSDGRANRECRSTRPAA